MLNMPSLTQHRYLCGFAVIHTVVDADGAIYGEVDMATALSRFGQIVSGVKQYLFEMRL